jgi:3-carboxy-cis,cis-muconate cycloisomerase
MRRPLLDVMLSDDAVEELLSDEAQFAAMVRVEIALAEAGSEVGLISRDAAAAIAAALDGFSPDWADLGEGMVRDGVVVPRLVAQMRKAVGPQHAEALHKGATSQDIVDTALMLQLKPIIALFVDRLEALSRDIEGLIARDGARPLMAHTRMQAALPFTVATKLRTWSDPLGQHRHNLASTDLALQLGGPIGDRSSFAGKGDEIARLMARSLGLTNVPAWQSSRARIATLGGHLAQLTGTLGKIGADIALMAQSEVGAVSLADGGTSSAMPHKSNPVSAELLVALARHNATLVSSLYGGMVHEQERSGAAWTLEWLTLPQMLRHAGGALRIARHLLGNMRFA